MADTIRRHARKADHVARLGPSRFGVLLPETDEVAAINYVERVRQACDLWLESGRDRAAPGHRLGKPGRRLEPERRAQAQAIERMFGEMRRGALREHGADARSTDPAPGLKGAPSAV